MEWQGIKVDVLVLQQFGIEARIQALETEISLSPVCGSTWVGIAAQPGVVRKLNVPTSGLSH